MTENNKKKKKKRIKRKRMWILSLLLVLIGAAAAFYYQRQQQEVLAAQAGQSAVEAGENQVLQYGGISTIAGNEITIKVLEAKNQREYTETGETMEYRIPVGTDVETRLGSITTFSRLASGDRIAILFDTAEQEEFIRKIWIVG